VQDNFIVLTHLKLECFGELLIHRRQGGYPQVEVGVGIPSTVI